MIPHISIEQAKAIYPNDIPGGCEEWLSLLNGRIDKVNAQPEPIDLHASLRAEYAKQLAEGTTGFYLWEVDRKDQGKSHRVLYTPKERPAWSEGYKYRCTDISCYVSKDGEPAIRMLRTEAQALQRQTKDTHDWFMPNNLDVGIYFEPTFRAEGTYTYYTKATIKLDGNMVTPEQAMTEWVSKKDTHDVWVNQMLYVREDSPRFTDTEAIYKLRPKQPKLKQLDWSKVPVGVMTNKGEFRGVYIDHHFETLADIEPISDSAIGMGWRVDGLSELRIAPSSEQKWIALQDGVCALYEGLIYEKRDAGLHPISYKAIGLAEGYTDGGDV